MIIYKDVNANPVIRYLFICNDPMLICCQAKLQLCDHMC